MEQEDKQEVARCGLCTYLVPLRAELLLQPLLQPPHCLLVVVDLGAELGVAAAQLQVPGAQVQNLLPVSGVLWRRRKDTILKAILHSESQV